MTKEQMQAEAIDRARNGQSLSNYPAIFAGFMARGIAEADIKPRENVFTVQYLESARSFGQAWRARRQGCHIRRG
jgi:hypothetical protein